MPRLLSTLLVVALLGGTAAAFAVTQGLKIEPSPILAPRIAKVFSPTCDCATRLAAIQFKLRKPDRVRLEIVDGHGDVVRTLVAGERLRRGTVHYTWNGRDDSGSFVGQGVYKPRVHLEAQHRTIDLPNEMRVDTTAPHVVTLKPAGKRAVPLSISPDGDGRADRITLDYELSERGHALLFVDGKRQIFTRGQKPAGSITWNGKVDGVVAARGPHVLTVAGQDLAGNVGPATSIRVGVRYIELAKRAITAKARTRFGVRVLADAPFSWRFAGKTGVAQPGLLVLRAPKKPREYPLVVTVGPHQDRATVTVEKR